MTDDLEAMKEKLRALAIREAEELRRTLTRKDDVTSALLRFHLLTEYQLERIIIAKFPRGDRLLEQGGLSFQQKLAVVHALDAVSDKVVSCLKALNRVRNRLSHELEASPAAADIDAIGRPLGKEFLEMKAKLEEGLILAAFMTFALVYSHLISEVTALDHKVG